MSSLDQNPQIPDSTAQRLTMTAADKVLADVTPVVKYSSDKTRVELWQAIDILNEHGVRLIKHRYADTSVRGYLEQIEPKEVAIKFLNMYDDHSFFNQVCGGAKHHHVETGGLSRHTCEMIGWCLDQLALYPGDWEGKVKKSEVIIACFLHDYSKIWTYQYLSAKELDEGYRGKDYEPWQEFKPIKGSNKFLTDEAKTMLEVSKYGIVLSEKIAGALLFAEGGHSAANFDYGGRSYVSETGLSDNPLAVLVSMADLYSACILGRNHRARST